jgi:hypothetical protein
MSTLRLTTLSNQGGTASVPSDTVINGTAKAWVNFNGTGTVAIRDAFNVSSITDNGTGDYTINFATAMANSNYVCNLTTDTSAGGANLVIMSLDISTARTPSTIRMLTFRPGNAVAEDSIVVSAAVFR